ncbi:MAG: SPOR domain-containing protein [Fibrobacteria bacterium]
MHSSSLERDSQSISRNRPSGFAGRRLARITLLSAVSLAACFWSGCAGILPIKHSQEDSPPESAPVSSQPAERSPETSGSSRRFEEAGELDRLLDAKPIALAAVKPASQGSPGASSAKASEPIAKGKGNFRIQIGAESDLDAAQLKKAEYERMLGGAVDVTFDAPYYKLRWGYFDSKQEAEDKLLELSDFKIQGFVIKQ